MLLWSSIPFRRLRHPDGWWKSHTGETCGRPDVRVRSGRSTWQRRRCDRDPSRTRDGWSQEQEAGILWRSTAPSSKPCRRGCSEWTSPEAVRSSPTSREAKGCGWSASYRETGFGSRCRPTIRVGVASSTRRNRRDTSGRGSRGTVTVDAARRVGQMIAGRNYGNEGQAFSSSAVREVPRDPAQGPGPHHLCEPEAQAGPGIGGFDPWPESQASTCRGTRASKSP